MTKQGKTPRKDGPSGQEWVGDDAYFSVACKPLKKKRNPDLNARKRRRQWARNKAAHEAERARRLLDE